MEILGPDVPVEGVDPAPSQNVGYGTVGMENVRAGVLDERMGVMIAVKAPVREVLDVLRMGDIFSGETLVQFASLLPHLLCRGLDRFRNVVRFLCCPLDFLDDLWGLLHDLGDTSTPDFPRFSRFDSGPVLRRHLLFYHML